MGLLLGDGCLVQAMSFSTNDHEELIPIIREMLPDGLIVKKQKGENYSWNIVTSKEDQGCGGNNKLINAIRELKLFNCRSHDKFIPDCFKFNTVEVRHSILQGMLDTDGHIAPC